MQRGTTGGDGRRVSPEAPRYTFFVTRRWILGSFLTLAAGLAPAQRDGRPELKRRGQAPKDEPPEPDEDEPGPEPEYTFNPIQAKKEVQIGDFYFKKKSYRAAAGRYERATRWQPGLADAYYKLGEAREKLGQSEQAVAAYQKFLEIDASSKKAEEVKKKVAQLAKEKPPAK